MFLKSDHYNLDQSNNRALAMEFGLILLSVIIFFLYYKFIRPKMTAKPVKTIILDGEAIQLRRPLSAERKKLLECSMQIEKEWDQNSVEAAVAWYAVAARAIKICVIDNNEVTEADWLKMLVAARGTENDGLLNLLEECFRLCWFKVENDRNNYKVDSKLNRQLEEILNSDELYKIFDNPGTDSESNAELFDHDQSDRSASTHQILPDYVEYDDYEYDDEFSIFFDEDEYDENYSENRTPATWLKSHEKVKIRGYEITKGNFYFGGWLPAENSYGPDASLVDDSLVTVSQPFSYEDESLSFEEKYSSISADCRGAYLNWLASSRDDLTARLGYVFLYLYGLERRVAESLENNELSNKEFKIIFQEVHRLNQTYGEPLSFKNDAAELLKSHSFDFFSSQLMEMMCILRPNVVSYPDLEETIDQDSLLVRYKVAKTINDGKPLPPDLAWAWLKLFSGYKFTKPGQRCEDEFSQLFCRLYTKKHRNGIAVDAKLARTDPELFKTQLKIKFTPANRSLRKFHIPIEELPHPRNFRKPLRSLIALADQCTMSLDSYSRYLGRNNTSRTDINAVLLLPDELSDLADSLGLGSFKTWAEESISKNSGLVDVCEYWRFTNIPLPAKINKKQYKLIQDLAEKTGYGVVPDTRYHNAKPKVDGKLALFHGGHGENFIPSKSFYEMAVTLRLGAMLATNDSLVNQSQFELLKQLIDNDTKLSSVESRSLHSYLSWRQNTPADRIGLKALLEKLNDAEKAAVGELLIDVALAGSKPDPTGIRQLEKLYTLLGLDKSLVSLDIHRRFTGENSSVRDAQLDESSISAHELQTEQVQTFLSEILGEEEQQVSETDTQDKIASAQLVGGLDDQHSSLYEILTAESEWSLDEFGSTCQKLGLMSGAAIDFINEWSIEKVDAPVIEEAADVIYIDQEIVGELEG